MRGAAPAILGRMTLDLSHFDAAIVDLDGTLVDTLGDFTAALKAGRAPGGLVPHIGAA